MKEALEDMQQLIIYYNETALQEREAGNEEEAVRLETLALQYRAIAEYVETFPHLIPTN